MRQAEQVHRAGADEQRLGRIETAGDAEHDLLDAGRREPLHERRDLDAVDLGTALVTGRRIGWHVGKAVDAAAQRARRHVVDRQVEQDRPEACKQRLVPRHRLAEGVLPHPLARDALEVDISGEQVRAVDEALRLREQLSALVDQRLAIPGEIGARLADAGRGVEIGRLATRRLLGDELVPVVGLADRDVGGREVDQHRRAGQCGEGRRRNRHPEVLADLGMQSQQRHVAGLEDQVVAERNARAEQHDVARDRVVGRGELAGLVELAVVGQIGLRQHAEHLAPAQHDGAVEEAVVDAQRHADDGQERQPGGGICDGRQRRFAGVEQGRAGGTGRRRCRPRDRARERRRSRRPRPPPARASSPTRQRCSPDRQRGCAAPPRRRGRNRGGTDGRTEAWASRGVDLLGQRASWHALRAPMAEDAGRTTGLGAILPALPTFAHRRRSARHGHRASPFQHDRAADPHLGGAGRRHPHAALGGQARRLRAARIPLDGLRRHRSALAERPEHAGSEGRGPLAAGARGAATRARARGRRGLGLHGGAAGAQGAACDHARDRSRARPLRHREPAPCLDRQRHRAATPMPRRHRRWTGPSTSS